MYMQSFMAVSVVVFELWVKLSMKTIRFVLFTAVKSDVFAGFKIYHSQNNMPSFIAVSVVVFKLLEYYQLKCGNPHICVFSAVQIEDFANFKTL